MLIQRRALSELLKLLESEHIVLVEGPPRCGLSTLAAQLARAEGPRALLAEAASPLGRALLAEPGQALRELGRGARPTPRLLLVDGAGAAEEASLRASLAAGGAEGACRFVLFGRAFPADSPLPRLALGPLSLAEVGPAARTSHWLRGGFPEAFGAPSEAAAAAWLARYADSISEERFAAAGLPWAPGRSRALLSMIAEAQGGPLNENGAARSLGLSRPTVARAAAALERAGLVRFLPSLRSPEGRRLPRAPAVYLRDSGLYHALLGILGMEALLGSARLAASWEGYVLGQLLAALPPGVAAARRAGRSGTALELVLSRPGLAPAAVSVRWARGGGPGRAAAEAAREIGAAQAWLVLPEAEGREREDGFVELGVAAAIERVERWALDYFE